MSIPLSRGSAVVAAFASLALLVVGCGAATQGAAGSKPNVKLSVQNAANTTSFIQSFPLGHDVYYAAVGADKATIPLFHQSPDFTLDAKPALTLNSSVGDIVPGTIRMTDAYSDADGQAITLNAAVAGGAAVASWNVRYDPNRGELSDVGNLVWAKAPAEGQTVASLAVYPLPQNQGGIWVPARAFVDWVDAKGEHTGLTYDWAPNSQVPNSSPVVPALTKNDAHPVWATRLKVPDAAGKSAVNVGFAYLNKGVQLMLWDGSGKQQDIALDLPENKLASLMVSNFAVVNELPGSPGTSETVDVKRFEYSGQPATYTAPTGVSVVKVIAVGGGGGGAGSGDSSHPYAKGGSGAVVTSYLPVEQAQPLTIAVGGAGTGPQVSSGGGGGGGSSSINPDDQGLRLIAAGGGGGRTGGGGIGGKANGGVGGDPTGHNGEEGPYGGIGGSDGKGGFGNDSGGNGVGGSGGDGGNGGTNGKEGKGGWGGSGTGTGGKMFSNAISGGGGGGGYGGGGAGNGISGSGGGGGSVGPSGLENIPGGTSYAIAQPGAPGAGGTGGSKGMEAHNGQVTIAALNPAAEITAEPGTDSAVISWSESAQPVGVGAVNYQVLINGEPVDGATTSPATISGLAAGVECEVSLESTTADGMRTRSDTIKVTPEPSPSPSPTPTPEPVSKGQLIAVAMSSKEGAYRIAFYQLKWDEKATSVALVEVPTPVNLAGFTAANDISYGDVGLGGKPTPMYLTVQSAGGTPSVVAVGPASQPVPNANFIANLATDQRIVPGTSSVGNYLGGFAALAGITSTGQLGLYGHNANLGGFDLSRSTDPSVKLALP